MEWKPNGPSHLQNNDETLLTTAYLFLFSSFSFHKLSQMEWQIDHMKGFKFKMRTNHLGHVQSLISEMIDWVQGATTWCIFKRSLLGPTFFNTNYVIARTRQFDKPQWLDSLFKCLDLMENKGPKCVCLVKSICMCLLYIIRIGKLWPIWIGGKKKKSRVKLNGP